MDKKTIRFIDSHYNDLFHIPDGGRIKIIQYNGEELIRQCKYIDDYHLSIHKEGDEYGNTFHICEFAEICERNGNTYEPVIENEYRLDALNVEDMSICDNRDAVRSCAAMVSGNFGMEQDQYYSGHHANDKALFTDEFHSELCEVMNYFRLKADTPILKSASDMIEICENNAGFEVSNAFTTANHYKISTVKNTYFLCCMPKLQECNFNIYCYENKQLERLKDVMFADKTYGNIEADKFFKSSDGFTELFYNPDATAGGQVVVNEISNALIKEAAQFKTADAFFEHINEGCNQSLIDAGTPAFRRTVKELVESKADLEGINKDTMKGLIKATGIKPKSKETER